jgi:hypothetical protein
VYCEALKTFIEKDIQKKWHGMLTHSVVLIHDNAPLHTAADTRALLEHFNWELFDHPYYNSDFVSS